MNIEKTLVRLARRLQSRRRDSRKKREALAAAFMQVLQLVQLTHRRAGAAYQLGNALISVDDHARRNQAIDHFLDIIDAGIPEASDTVNRLELTVGLTRHLHAAGFTAKEIAELIDDGRGGSPAQRQERVKSRFSDNVLEPLQNFWSNAVQTGENGARHSL